MKYDLRGQLSSNTTSLTWTQFKCCQLWDFNWCEVSIGDLFIQNLLFFDRFLTLDAMNYKDANFL